MKINLKELEALARAATPGPWLHRHDPGNPVGCQHGVKLPGELGAWIGDCIDNADRSTEGGVAGERNAAFIAAANPAAVLELIAEVETLRIELAKNNAQMLRMATCAGEFAKDACKTYGERDAARLDLLEQMGNEPEGLLLHDGGDFTGRRGLGLRRIGRTLRQAVDAMVAQQDEKGGAP